MIAGAVGMLAALVAASGCSGTPAAGSEEPAAAAMAASERGPDGPGGKELFETNCASCHGRNLRGTETGQPLTGRAFQLAWQGRTGAQLSDYSRAVMPPETPGSLDEEMYVRIAAYILEENGFGEGGEPITPDRQRLEQIVIQPRPAS